MHVGACKKNSLQNISAKSRTSFSGVVNALLLMIVYHMIQVMLHIFNRRLDNMIHDIKYGAKFTVFLNLTEVF